MSQANLKLKTTFDEVAENYHAYRIHYPDELFGDLIEVAKITTESQLLEIGPGTGQATLPLAQKGYQIMAVELGENLAEVAKRELKEFKNVKIITGAFEEVDLPVNSFNLIYSATAFHWVKPDYQYKKTCALLKDEGHLAIIQTKHVSDEAGDKFFHASQPFYDAANLKLNKLKYIQPKNAEIEPYEIDESLFKHVFFKTYPLKINFTAEGYTNLLSTYSSTIAMPPEVREKFLSGIKNLIETEFNGSIEKHLTIVLTIAKKK